MASSLPPGPPYPALVQGIGTWTRPLASLETYRARYGKRFTVRFPFSPPFVVLCDPNEIKEVFLAPADVLHPGEGARVLEPLVGKNSLILLDEAKHMEQRKLMLPAFHGEKMARLGGLMTEVAEREVAAWPGDQPIALQPRTQRLTLEIILRAVFGLDSGQRLEELRDLLSELLAFGDLPISLAPPDPEGLVGRILARWGPLARFVRIRETVDALLFELIDERRREGAERDDVLTMLLEARHADGAPMSSQELRDELMTLLVAGHETTASSLAWGFERLARSPRVLARLVKRPFELGGRTYPPGVCLVPNAYLVHHDPQVYADPYDFRPERFIDEPPGTYTWIPFGGGRRRCIGASFAMLEMQVVLRAALRSWEVTPAEREPELARRRNITVRPGKGARVTLRARSHAATAAPS